MMAHYSNYKGDDRRKYPRKFFSLEDNITGLFLIPGLGEKPIYSYILNLSAGGLYFTPKAGRDANIKKGDKIVLIQLHASQSEPFILNIDAEIKWILDPAMLDHIGIGCFFIDMPESNRERLKSFIDSIPAREKIQ